MEETNNNIPNNQTPPTQQVPVPTPVPTPNTDQPVNQMQADKMKFGNFVKNIKPIAKEVLSKILANKKLTYLLAGLFGIIFLIIILGLLFGKRVKTTPTSTTKTPEPASQNFGGNPSSPSGILGESVQKLKVIEGNIINFDIQQNRLLPPTVDFDVNF